MPVASKVHIWIWAFCLVAVIGLMSFGLYLEHVKYLDPCPLCITQRLFYIMIGLFALVGLVAFRSRLVQRIDASLMFLSAIGGIVTAGRQVWLQHLPADQVPACGPGLQYWLDNNPMLETLSLLFKGDGNCAEVQWQFLGLSIGEWSLAWFILFMSLSVYQFFKTR